MTKVMLVTVRLKGNTSPPETKRHFDSRNESQQLRYTFPSLLEPARCRVQVRGSRRAAGTPKEKGALDHPFEVYGGASP